MRNRLIKVLLLPVVVFVWMVGWAMMWAGTLKEEETRPETVKKEGLIKIMPMMPDEQEQCEAKTGA